MDKMIVVPTYNRLDCTKRIVDAVNFPEYQCLWDIQRGEVYMGDKPEPDEYEEI